MSQANDPRPAAAVGHVFLSVSDVASATRRLESIGLRIIVARPTFAVIELRGGTHIVVRAQEPEGELPAQAPFDLMYDDIEAAHARFQAAGFEVSHITNGRVHAGFDATAPERYVIRVVNSHAGTRPV